MATGLSKLLIAAPAILIFGIVSGASPYAQVATDGTVGPRVGLAGPDFDISADLGTRAGRNLFHSFERFSLATGEQATFSGPDQIRNVISRVTGGARSDIDGTLRSTIPGADFYFLNPAGVVFGPNASLDLQGSFHVSTADELRFADGARFSATDPAASSFTVAAPEAFGFLGAHEPAPILVDRSTLAVPVGEALSFIGGDITIDGGNDGVANGGEQGLVRAAAGQITLAAVVGSGEARLGSGDVAADQAAVITLVDQAFVDASGDGGGTIRIRGGAFLVDDAAVAADNTGEQAGGGGLNVRAGVARIRGGRLTADARAGGPAGSVSLVADRLTITDGGRIDSSTFGAGAGGNVTLDVGRLELLRDGARVAAATFGPGPAGDLTVNAGEILAVGADPATRNPSGLFASSVDEGPDAGDGGSVMIDVDLLELRAGAQVAAVTRGPGAAGSLTVNADHVIAAEPQAGSGIPSGLFANSLGDGPDAGDGGSIVLDVDRLELLGGGQVFAGTFGPGDGGDARVDARAIVAAGADAATGFPSGIFAGSQGAGDAGNVTVSVDRLTLLDGGQIGSSALEESMGAGGVVRVTADSALLIAGESVGASPSGIFASAQGATVSEEDAGNLIVSAGELEIRDGGIISGSTFTAGDAGTVTVTADTLTIRDGGEISGSTFSAGDAGTVEVTADALVIRDGGNVSSRTFAEGDAGIVTVSANRLVLLDGGQISSSPLQESTGAGGVVRVTASDTALIAGFASGIFASAEGATDATENAGDVAVSAGKLEVRDGGLISSSTASAGNAGKVTITADRIEFVNDGRIFNGTDGAGNGGDITVRAGTIFADVGSDPTINHTGISASAKAGSSGQGGDVTVTANQITLVNDAEITSSTQGQGAGGDVVVYAREALNLDAGFIGASSLEGATETGDAGTVTIYAGKIEFINDGRIFNGTDGEGDGGDVTVRAGTIFADIGSNPTVNHTGISASANAASSGRGGNVMVTADRIRLINGAEISSDTKSIGAAGTVTVFANEIELSRGGQIFTTSSSTGDAGSIAIVADRVDLDRGRINTDTASTGGGEIRLSVSDVITLRDSAITTSVTGGADPTAGSILIDPEVLVIDGSRIQANAGTGNGGQLRIEADNILVPGGDFQALIDRGDISASGGTPERAGTITVNAPEVDLSGGLVVLEGALLDAASQLRERCGARRDIGVSSFTGVGRGGLPASPDGPLAGAYLAAAPSGDGGVEGRAAVAASFDRPVLVAAPCLGAP